MVAAPMEHNGHNDDMGRRRRQRRRLADAGEEELMTDAEAVDKSREHVELGGTRFNPVDLAGHGEQVRVRVITSPNCSRDGEKGIDPRNLEDTPRCGIGRGTPSELGLNPHSIGNMLNGASEAGVVVSRKVGFSRSVPAELGRRCAGQQGGDRLFRPYPGPCRACRRDCPTGRMRARKQHVQMFKRAVLRTSAGACSHRCLWAPSGL
ncbi:hypothetical protein T492DRAFT_834469 [Pavlovales sp. CCMP2436]|nr:hypothetical protein T492DRAFT_834469 [Pavlovales sp. CCMP2436]